MERWIEKSTCTPAGVPFSRICVLLTGREHIASLLDCVAGWAQPRARIRITGLAGAPSGGDAAFQAAQGFTRRLVLAAVVDAACETLLQRGFVAETETLEADSAADQTAALARTVCASQAQLTIGAPPSPVALAGSTQRPVLVLPTPFARRCQVPPQRIFVASNGSAACSLAVSEAARVAAPGAAVRVGYLACDPADARHPEDFDTVVLAAQRDGDAAAHAIVDAALQWRADLLVLGTRGGHAGGRGRYGSVAADVARRTVLPLLLVPQASRCADRAAASGMQ